jgi:hypothetical protein
MPVISCLIKSIVNVLNCVVQVHSQECVRKSESKSIIRFTWITIVEGEYLRNVSVWSNVNRVHSEPCFHSEHHWEKWFPSIQLNQGRSYNYIISGDWYHTFHIFCLIRKSSAYVLYVERLCKAWRRSHWEITVSYKRFIYSLSKDTWVCTIPIEYKSIFRFEIGGSWPSRIPRNHESVISCSIHLTQHKIIKLRPEFGIRIK